MAVVAHGILIAGFGFVAAEAISSPFQRDASGLLCLVPAALVALAFARWLHGGRRWLILFDLLIAAVRAIESREDRVCFMPFLAKGERARGNFDIALEFESFRRRLAGAA